MATLFRSEIQVTGSVGISFNLPLARRHPEQSRSSGVLPAERGISRVSPPQQQANSATAAGSYPFTLIFENDSTARLCVGRPIDSAGRKVVKISICFTWGKTSESLESERMR
jgi:hypothetical protein